LGYKEFVNLLITDCTSTINISSHKFFISVIKATSTENCYQRSGVVAVTKPDQVVLKHLELVCRRNFEEFGDARYRSPRML
jgi:hypothetical protein